MIPTRAEVVVCGAGIAGLSAAWHLAVRRGVRDVVVVDDLPPLSLTSDKSTECYRNWWPDAAMVALINRSIELLDELAAASDNRFSLNRNGYLYLTATADGREQLIAAARRTSAAGAGPLRILEPGAASPPALAQPAWDHFVPLPREHPAADGADLLLDPIAIRRAFPWVAADTRAALWARRCGWLSAQQLGMLWLEQAREAGVQLVRGRLGGVELAGGRVAAVELHTGETTHRIATSTLVDAAGPQVGAVAAMVGVELPIVHELHRKVIFDDHLGRIPRELPLVIWNDPVRLDLGEDEQAELAADPATASFVDEVPAGVHFRPEGGAGSHSLVLLWNYHCPAVTARFPLPDDPLHVPLVVRGVARVAPAFGAYRDLGRRPRVDGGYYTKTRENRPLVGPLGPPGAYVLGALSGFGIMASPAAGELLAAHLLGDALPASSRSFLLTRYQDPAYVAALGSAEAGQL